MFQSKYITDIFMRQISEFILLSIWISVAIWRYGSVVKRAFCPCRGPGFDSEQPCDGSQLSGTPVPGDHF